MKIAMMLRHFEQKDGGVKVYTQRLLPGSFAQGARHEFVLMYQNPRLIGTNREFENVREIRLRLPGTMLWDQVAPWAAAKAGVDWPICSRFRHCTKVSVSRCWKRWPVRFSPRTRACRPKSAKLPCSSIRRASTALRTACSRC